MTDNRTTELRAKLMERGVMYQAIGKRLTYWNRDGSDNECDDADFVADEQNGYLIVEGLTPEQAIAATLGSGREKALEKLIRDLTPFVCADDGIEDIEARMRALGLTEVD